MSLLCCGLHKELWLKLWQFCKTTDNLRCWMPQCHPSVWMTGDLWEMQYGVNKLGWKNKPNSGSTVWFGYWSRRGHGGQWCVVGAQINPALQLQQSPRRTVVCSAWQRQQLQVGGRERNQTRERCLIGLKTMINGSTAGGLYASCQHADGSGWGLGLRGECFQQEERQTKMEAAETCSKGKI